MKAKGSDHFRKGPVIFLWNCQGSTQQRPVEEYSNSQEAGELAASLPLLWPSQSRLPVFTSPSLGEMEQNVHFPNVILASSYCLKA